MAGLDRALSADSLRPTHRPPSRSDLPRSTRGDAPCSTPSVASRSMTCVARRNIRSSEKPRSRQLR